MATSKRTRFEVLRRDNYTCRYCRSTENELTIDHVVPTALGGSDLPSNLVACCRDCNSGKASSAPDASLVEQVDDDAVRWALARVRAAERIQLRYRDLAERRQPFLDAWHAWDKDETWLPRDWRSSIDWWLNEGITMDQLLEAVDITLPKRQIPHNEVMRYVAGIVKNWIAELDAETLTQLEQGRTD